MKTFLHLMTAFLVLCQVAAVSGATQPAVLVAAAAVEIQHSNGKFDFLRIDPLRHRLLAAHENDGTMDFIDLQTHKVITRLKVGGAVDSAFDTYSKFYYVSVQEAARVAVIDASALKEVNSVKTAGPTDAIIYEPKNHRVYVTHDDGAEVWVIDPATNTVVATVSVPGVPEFMVYDESADRIYLNIKSKDVVAVIDPSSNQVVKEWSTLPARQPHGMALDVAAHHLFSAGGNGKLVMIDTQSGSAANSVDIVPKVDQIAFDAVGSLVYCAGPEKMSVIRASGGKLTAVGEVQTAETAKNVAVDPTTREVWSTFTDGKSSFAKSWRPPQS